MNKHLSPAEFEALLQSPESTTLDFKKEMYSFDKTDDEKIGAYIKDILAFCNTIRTEPSYIIIGVKVLEDGKKDLVGLTNFIDESILQAKVKDKVIPIPVFSYYTCNHEGKTFGVFQFPIYKYEYPLSATVKLKGIVPGEYYHRVGTSNEVAIGRMGTNISDWLKELPSNNKVLDDGFSSKLTYLLKKATNNQILLSEVMAEALVFAKKHSFKELEKLCKCELQGYISNPIVEDVDWLKYRTQQVKCSLNKVTLNPYRRRDFTAQQFIDELETNNVGFDYRLIIPYSIADLESHITSSAGDKQFTTITSSRDEMIGPSPGKKNHPVYIYLFHHNFDGVYKNVRQKLIDLLITI